MVADTGFEQLITHLLSSLLNIYPSLHLHCVKLDQSKSSAFVSLKQSEAH